MMVWVLPVLFIFVGITAIALLHRREGFAEICKRIRKTTRCILSFAAVCLVGAIVLSSTLTYAGNYLNSVLSIEFITEVREALRELFGTESVFTSLQMLGALSAFLFSFVSCACIICNVFIFFLCTQLQKKEDVLEYEQKVESLQGGNSLRRFALLSRYLI